jgi:arylformamidase
MIYKYLSHFVSEGMPVYGGRARLGIKARRSITKGDTSNVYRLTLENHWGTHIDAPHHFFNSGDRIDEYGAQSWFFTKPEVVRVSLRLREVLCSGKWMKQISRSCDILLLRSGWSRFRKEEKYIYENPGIHPEVAIYLRQHFPRLRAIGIDWLSISSGSHKPLGRQAHRAFLDPSGAGNPLFIIEDMLLPSNLSGLRKIIAAPFIVAGIDSAPCTVLGEFL